MNPTEWLLNHVSRSAQSIGKSMDNLGEHWALVGERDRQREFRESENEEQRAYETTRYEDQKAEKRRSADEAFAREKSLLDYENTLKTGAESRGSLAALQAANAAALGDPYVEPARFEDLGQPPAAGAEPSMGNWLKPPAGDTRPGGSSSSLGNGGSGVPYEAPSHTTIPAEPAPDVANLLNYAEATMTTDPKASREASEKALALINERHGRNDYNVRTLGPAAKLNAELAKNGASREERMQAILARHRNIGRTDLSSLVGSARDPSIWDDVAELSDTWSKQNPVIFLDAEGEGKRDMWMRGALRSKGWSDEEIANVQDPESLGREAARGSGASDASTGVRTLRTKSGQAYTIERVD